MSCGYSTSRRIDHRRNLCDQGEIVFTLVGYDSLYGNRESLLLLQRDQWKAIWNWGETVFATAGSAIGHMEFGRDCFCHSGISDRPYGTGEN